MFGHLRKTRAQLIEILQYHCALEFLCCKHAHLPKATYKQKSVGRYQVRLRTCNQYRPNPIIPSGFPSPSPYDFHKSPASRIDDTCKPVTPNPFQSIKARTRTRVLSGIRGSENRVVKAVPPENRNTRTKTTQVLSARKRKICVENCTLCSTSQRNQRRPNSMTASSTTFPLSRFLN
jgi:hypothetical protein